MRLFVNNRTTVVGIIMGTRLWYQMWDSENDDDDAFERRLDDVVREIGERGKLVLDTAPPAEPTQRLAHTPASTLSPAPALAPVLAPAISPAAAAATRPQAPPVLDAPTSLLAHQTAHAPLLGSSALGEECHELRRQVQQISSQLANMEASRASATSQLSDAFCLERERVAERQAERERSERAERAERVERAERAERAHRERIERVEARLVATLSVGMCTCGLGVAIGGVALALRNKSI